MLKTMAVPRYDRLVSTQGLLDLRDMETEVEAGSSNLYATEPILCRTRYDPKNLKDNF